MKILKKILLLVVEYVGTVVILLAFSFVGLLVVFTLIFLVILFGGLAVE